MAKSASNNQGLIVAIVLAALLVSGSLVFLGIQLAKDKGLSNEDLQAQIFEGIDAYIADQQQKYAEAQAEADKPREVDGDFTDDDAFLGDEDAPVAIVEFSDYQCPYCKAFHDETLPKLKETYIDTGKVKFVYRDLPISKHPYAYPAALFAECARDQGGDEVYFEVHDQIFETISNGFDYEALSDFATTLGVDEDELKECFDNEKFKEEIYADDADAESIQINGTPGFVVNNWVISGARPYEYFVEIIEAELAKEE